MQWRFRMTPWRWNLHSAVVRRPSVRARGLGGRCTDRSGAIPLTVAAYYLMTIGMGGLDATSRFRYPILFVAYWLAGHALVTVIPNLQSWTSITNFAWSRNRAGEELRR